MAKEFRIVPKQAPPLTKSGVRGYGFVIRNHPKGDPSNDGKYIAAWETFEVAAVAANILGVPLHEVQPVQCWVFSENG